MRDWAACCFNLYIAVTTFAATLGLGFQEERPMPWTKSAITALLAGIILSAALAENAAAQAPIRARPSTIPGTVRPPRLEPCWEVAGLSKSAIRERRAIAQQARQQVEAVCANSSLSARQRRQEIQRIHQQEQQQIEAIITPAQQAAMRSCEESRNGRDSGGRPRSGHCGASGGKPAPHNFPPHRFKPPHGKGKPPEGAAKPQCN